MQLGLARVIDPRLLPLVEGSREFYSQRVAGRGPSSRDELRSVRGRVAGPVASTPPAVAETFSLGGRAAAVRIHEPIRTAAGGVFLEILGGGFYMGSAADGDVRNQRLADSLGIAVVSVEFRLAPEHPWPSGPDDCETAALWLVEHALQRVGTSKLIIGGFSAGTTLAMATLLRLRDRHVTTFDSAVLQFGTYDLSVQTPAGRLIAEEFFLEVYAGGAPDRTDPDISPVYADLARLPPVLVVVGAEDVLLRDNPAMAAQLSAAGVDVDLRVNPASPHGFTHHPTAVAGAALEDIETWLRSWLNYVA